MSTTPASSRTVTVTGLASATTQQTLEHFLSFCGKIETITFEQGSSSASVTFVKESAAKTALLLSGGQLDGSAITVASDDVEAPAVLNAQPKESTAETPSEKEGHDVEQEDKPRAAIFAEYLAHGYSITDSVIEKGLAADTQYGISARFLSFFNPLAAKAQTVAQPHVDRAAEKLKDVDEKQGLSLKANAAAIISSKYYQAALASPFGKKVEQFYTTTSKQVRDVHDEAIRIKESKKSSSPTPLADDAPIPSAGTAGVDGKSDTAPLQTTTA